MLRQNTVLGMVTMARRVMSSSVEKDYAMCLNSNGKVSLRRFLEFEPY